MWPYSKIKHTQPDLKQAECPICTGPTTAEQYPDVTIITNTCIKCLIVNSGTIMEGDKMIFTEETNAS